MRERQKGPPAVGYHTGEPTEPPRQPAQHAGIGSHKPSRVIRLEVSTGRESGLSEGETVNEEVKKVSTVREWLRKQVKRLRSHG